MSVHATEVSTLAAAASAVLEPVYARLESLAGTVVATRPRRGGWSESHLGPVKEELVRLLGEDRIAIGLGYVAAPGEVDGQERFMAWWQRHGDRVSRLRLNFDPTSIDVYDYLQMEWFQLAREGRRRVAFGPYVDYSGSDLYIVTATVPVVADGRFVGVVGADVVVSELERRMVDVLRRAPTDAVLVNAERRVIAANSPRWVVGGRLAAMPADGADVGADHFLAVAELPVGNGWVVALSRPR